MLRTLVLVGLVLVVFCTLPCVLADVPPPDDTVQSYLHALDNKRPYIAASYVYFNRENMRFGASPDAVALKLANLEMQLGADKFNLTNLNIEEKKLSDDGMQAVLKVSYDIVDRGDPSNVLKSITEWYRLEYIGEWKIINIDNRPLELLPIEELPEPPSESSGTSVIDILSESAVYLLPVAFLMMVVGIRLNSIEKRKKGGTKATRPSASFMIPPEKASKFIKVTPQPIYRVGKPAQLTMWIKNFTSVPYTNVEASATFPRGISLNTPILKFGDIPPGKVAKRAWVITPKSSGVLVVAEPMVMFEYKGKRGIAMLEPIKLRAK